MDGNELATLFVDDGGTYEGPALTDAMIKTAEDRLGVRLPLAYLAILRYQNGGSLARACFKTTFPTSWAPDHLAVRALLGIGGEWGIDSAGPLGSRSMIAEWGYPDIGVVLFDMPSGGHDAVLLDYRQAGREPAVAYVDEDREPRIVASSFLEFMTALQPEP